MNVACIREGLALLQDEAREREREDVYNKCAAIIAMSDEILLARQHEIQALKCLGFNPLQYGYLEFAILHM